MQITPKIVPIVIFIIEIQTGKRNRFPAIDSMKKATISGSFIFNNILISYYPTTLTLSASGPFLPSLISNSTA
ncbi:hypothetical protein J2T04_003468 [Chryseobacterium lathyri]|uniref:Uncharacterized protein n=1 Tax=Chryseobacterium lathyri TaxID=395933 RepID=A0ABT9SRG8_9FLAO|nr:hypothetical protein [Chryseobacterium lathyri]MDQ0065351.1 hypothetical protein [Chryseobacterium lathyri]